MKKFMFFIFYSLKKWYKNRFKSCFKPSGVMYSDTEELFFTYPYGKLQ
jgi:hypothetical protein